MNSKNRERGWGLLVLLAWVFAAATATGIGEMVASPASQLLHPLVVVPGSGGNQLEARLTDAYKPSSLFCARAKGEWFRLWFDASVLFPSFTRCFSERMRLVYDAATDTYSNAPGVETRVPNFGSTRPLLHLDPDLKKITSYMAPLVEALERIGYVDEQTLFGAPYDFRYGLGGHSNVSSSVGSKFLADLKHLVERASSINGGKKVILMSHSLGGLWTLHLLNSNTLSWRRKYVEHFIALSSPWAGTVQELIVFASGYSLGVPLVNPLLVRDEQRSSESNLWLLPSPTVYGRKPLVITPNRTYSAFDVPEFLADIGFPEGVYPYETRIRTLMSEIIAPLVPVTCMIGTGVKTPETLFYGAGGFDKQPDVVNGEGDGTVNLASLLAVEWAWDGIEGQTLKVRRLPHGSHTSILSDEASIREIIQEISSINSLVSNS